MKKNEWKKLFFDKFCIEKMKWNENVIEIVFHCDSIREEEKEVKKKF